jgi:cytochrome b561
MTHVSARPDRTANCAWHAALGYDFLALLLLRLLWRWTNPVPALLGALPRWEGIAAHAGHIGLYVLMLAASVTGWALAGTFRNPMAADLLGLSVPKSLRAKIGRFIACSKNRTWSYPIYLRFLFSCTSWPRCAIILGSTMMCSNGCGSARN